MISVYIHIPFCTGKCRYCGFYSTHFDSSAAEPYISSLLLEIETATGLLSGRKVQSIYLGGGTPTTLSEAQIERMLRGLQERLLGGDERECTVEANPDSASSGKLHLLRALGFTRLSLGVQSFDDQELRLLGRQHTVRQAEDAFRSARQAGFPSVSMDLIYGIPGQDRISWERTLRRAVVLGPDHLSVYALTLDEGSRLADDVRHGRVATSDDELAAELYEQAVCLLAGEGYEQYELSSFARPSHACRHNMHYWDRGEHLGLGASAWSFLNGRRTRNISDLAAYTAGMQRGERIIDFEETVTKEEAAGESLMLGMRRTAGVDLAVCTGRFRDQDRQGIGARIEALSAEGLVEVRRGMLRFTPRGRLLANEVISRLLP